MDRWTVNEEKETYTRHNTHKCMRMCAFVCQNAVCVHACARVRELNCARTCMCMCAFDVRPHESALVRARVRVRVHPQMDLCAINLRICACARARECVLVIVRFKLTWVCARTFLRSLTSQTTQATLYSCKDSLVCPLPEI